jgi:hypothetical protein
MKKMPGKSHRGVRITMELLERWVFAGILDYIDGAEFKSRLVAQTQLRSYAATQLHITR